MGIQGVRLAKSEREARSIANKLVIALTAIEHCQCDPAMIFDDAEVQTNSSGSGVKQSLNVLKKHYCGEEI